MRHTGDGEPSYVGLPGLFPDGLPSALPAPPKPTRAEIVAHMDGNICRCATYGRILKAIQRAAAES